MISVCITVLCAFAIIFISDLNIGTIAAVAAVCGFASMVTALYVIVKYIFKPYIDRRRAALRALGTHGVSKVNKDPTARLAYKGIYEFFKQNFAKSEEYLNLALSRSDFRQNQLFCIEWLIHLYEAADNLPKLLWCYRKAADYAPDNPEFQSRLGHVYYVDGKLDKAMYCFEQALRYDPNHGYSYYSIAKIQIVRGEDKKAEETLNTLIKINENHPLVYSELATLAAMHGENERCEEYYKKALLCGYKDPDELQKRISAIMKFGNTEGVDGGDLPNEYYRRIEPNEMKTDGSELPKEKD